MADVIIAPNTAAHAFYFPYSNDFHYVFNRGSERYAFLKKHPTDIDFDLTPAIFRSTDGGASFSLQDEAGAPIASKSGQGSITYDARFNSISPTSKSGITLIYPEEPRVGNVYNMHLVTFDFTTHSYGAPFGAFAIDSLDGNHYFSSRPDGSYIFVYTRDVSTADSTPIGTYYRIYSGGAWGGETLLDSTTTVHVQNLAVDNSGNSHVFVDGTYYRIDLSGAIVAGPVSVMSPSVNYNIVIAGSSIYVAYRDASNLALAIGTPLSAPVWTLEPVVSGAGAKNAANVVWFSAASGAYAIDLERLVTLSNDVIIDSQGFTASGPSLHWITSDEQHVQRSIKSSGAWGAPSTVWSIAAGSQLSSLNAGAGAGAGPAARYRPLFHN